MKIIAVMSPKGGVGKTTTADSIAYILGEEHGKRVLVIDGDPQGDTSKTFGAYEPEGIGLSELLERHVNVGGDYRTSELIQTTQYEHIDIIPANGYLMRTDMNLLLKQEENNAVCAVCMDWLSRYGFADEASQDDACSEAAMLEICRAKLQANSQARLMDDIAAARKAVQSRTAWRIEGTLREFPKFSPVNLWFDYPIHRMDCVGVLKDIAPEAEQPQWKRAMSKR